jgi:hypothetical protein
MNIIFPLNLFYYLHQLWFKFDFFQKIKFDFFQKTLFEIQLINMMYHMLYA